MHKSWVWGTTEQVSLTTFWVVGDSQTTGPKSPPGTLSAFSHQPWSTIKRTLTVLGPLFTLPCWIFPEPGHLELPVLLPSVLTQGAELPMLPAPHPFSFSRQPDMPQVTSASASLPHRPYCPLTHTHTHKLNHISLIVNFSYLFFEPKC